MTGCDTDVTVCDAFGRSGAGSSMLSLGGAVTEEGLTWSAVTIMEDTIAHTFATVNSCEP